MTHVNIVYRLLAVAIRSGGGGERVARSRLFIAHIVFQHVGRRYNALRIRALTKAPQVTEPNDRAQLTAHLSPVNGAVRTQIRRTLRSFRRPLPCHCLSVVQQRARLNERAVSAVTAAHRTRAQRDARLLTVVCMHQGQNNSSIA